MRFNVSLDIPKFDTARPAINDIGKSLIYCKCISAKQHDKSSLIKYPDKEAPIMMKATYSELELELLQQNMLFINKQYKKQIKEMIRNEKMDLNLGEAIKDFYLHPIF